MKKLIVTFAILVVALLVAIYIAMAPLASPTSSDGINGLLMSLDGMVDAIEAGVGRSVGALIALGTGVVLAMIAGIALSNSDSNAGYAESYGDEAEGTRFTPFTPSPVDDEVALEEPVTRPPEDIRPAPAPAPKPVAAPRPTPAPAPAPVQQPEPEPEAEIDPTPVPRIAVDDGDDEGAYDLSGHLADPANRGSAAFVPKSKAAPKADAVPPVEVAAPAPAQAPVEEQPELPDFPPAPDLGNPPVVVLVRKEREAARDWFADTSWFGGLPRLGGKAWPRGASGHPMPFAAQIDLAALAAACPDTAIARNGSLAFFLGEGAVVHVEGEGHDFAEPPQDLAPAFDEGGEPLPAVPSRLSRWFFPFWPVSLHPAPVTEAERASGEVTSLVEARMAQPVAGRDHTFFAVGVGESVEALWWHGVHHLVARLEEALDHSGEPLAERRAVLEQARAMLAEIEQDPGIDADEREDMREDFEAQEAELVQLEQQRAALPEMIGALEGFAQDRDPWTALTSEELDVLRDFLPEVHERFGELIRHHAPGALGELATISLRAMISGPSEAVAAIPPETLARLNGEYRQPPEALHAMFMPVPGRGQDEIALLELAYDDLMEWGWPEEGRLRFLIAPAHAAAGRWDMARLVFTTD